MKYFQSFFPAHKEKPYSSEILIQRCKPATFQSNLDISEFMVDKTQLKVGSELWLWVTKEHKDRQILALNIYQDRNMFVAQRLLSRLIRTHFRHSISTK